MDTLFDRDFDREVEIAKERKKFREENPLRYTEADMEQIVNDNCQQAHAQGYQEGVEDGKKEMEQSIIKASYHVLEELRPQVSEFLTSIESHRNKIENDAMLLISELVNKVIPDLSDYYYKDKLKELILEVVQLSLGSDWIEFRLHPEIKDFLEEDIIQLLSLSGYQGSFLIKDIEDMPINSAELSWENGKSEINFENVKNEIVNIINKANN